MADIQGIDELDAAIAAMNRRLQERLPAIARSAADIVQAEIHARMPVDTGDMAANLDEHPAGGASAAFVTVEVVRSAAGGDEHKAIFQEFGTSKMAANPFFRPGIEAARSRVEAQLTRDLSKEFST